MAIQALTIDVPDGTQFEIRSTNQQNVLFTARPVSTLLASLSRVVFVDKAATLNPPTGSIIRPFPTIAAAVAALAATGGTIEIVPGDYSTEPDVVLPAGEWTFSMLGGTSLTNALSRLPRIDTGILTGNVTIDRAIVTLIGGSPSRTAFCNDCNVTCNGPQLVMNRGELVAASSSVSLAFNEVLIRAGANISCQGLQFRDCAFGGLLTVAYLALQCDAASWTSAKRQNIVGLVTGLTPNWNGAVLTWGAAALVAAGVSFMRFGTRDNASTSAAEDSQRIFMTRPCIVRNLQVFASGVCTFTVRKNVTDTPLVVAVNNNFGFNGTDYVEYARQNDITIKVDGVAPGQNVLCAVDVL